MHKNIKTVAGCFTNVTCNVTATDGRAVELTAYIAIGQERRPVPKAGAKLFAFPAVEYGQHLYEIRADGKPLIFGFLLVRPSAFPVAQGTVDYTLNATLDSVDALHVDIELTPGPRGYSAYEVAVMEGFVGSEAEWLEHMRQQTATMAVERVTPLMERAETAADKSEREAAAAKTGQETAAAHAKAAKESELAAAGHKTAAAGEVTKAAAEVEKAKQERETAAGHAEAAAKSAQDAETAKAGAEQAERDAQTAKSGSEQAAANADASKTAAQTAEDNAKASANAAAADKAAAAQAKLDAQAAKTKAEQEAQKAADNAELLGDAALQGRNNVFAAGCTQTFNGVAAFNGEVTLNESVNFPNGSTTAAEMAAGYFFARRYWELATDISNLFKGQYIDSLPKNDEGLVELNFPAAASGKDAFVNCHCSGAAISLPSVKTQDNLTAILCGLNNNNGNNTYGYGVFRLNLPGMTSINLNYPLRLWAKKIIIDAPKATYFKMDARKQSCYGNLPVVEEVRCDNTHYTSEPIEGYKWFVPLSMLKNGYFGDSSSAGGNKFRLAGDSVFCILGTIPIWEDGATHILHLNISHKLQNDASFQERLTAALGAMAEDGSYGGALVRTYSAEGASGTDELGAYDDMFVASKGWKITISYN